MDPKLKLFLENSAVVGVAAGASVVATDWLLDNYSASVGPGRAAMQAGGHAALGFGIAYLGMPRIGAGVAVGGVVSAVETLVEWGSLTEEQREALRLAQRTRIRMRRERRNADEDRSSGGSGSSASSGSSSGSNSGSASGTDGGGRSTGALGYGDAWSRYELPAYAYAMD